MFDSYNLDRFVRAQEPVYKLVCRELGDGFKQSHWIWFIFPQIKGLGHSPTANYYAITSLAEAETYLSHPILGARLRECTRLVMLVENRSIHDILGYPDDLKFRSCMTLFAQTKSDIQIFQDALAKYFDAQPDPLTLELL